MWYKSNTSPGRSSPTLSEGVNVPPLFRRCEFVTFWGSGCLSEILLLKIETKQKGLQVIFHWNLHPPLLSWSAALALAIFSLISEFPLISENRHFVTFYRKPHSTLNSTFSSCWTTRGVLKVTELPSLQRNSSS